MFAAMAGIAVVSVVVSAVSLYVVSSEGMRHNVSNRNVQIARRAAEEINHYIHDAFNFLESLGGMLMPVKDPWVADLILENAAATYGKYNSIHLIKADMSVSASSELDNRSAVFDVGFVTESAANRRLTFTDVRLSREELPYMDVVAPTGSGRFPRIVASLDLRDIWHLIDDISFGESGKAYLISGNGLLIAHPDKTKVLSLEGAKLLESMPTGNLTGAHYLTRNEQGVRLLAVTDDIPASGWRLIITQHLSEAFVPIKTILASASIVALISAGSAIVASFFLVRRYSNPLNRLIAGTELVREGRLDHRIEIDTSDEFGKLSSYFNSMVIDLEERSRRLAVSERKYRLVTESVNDIIFMLDGDGRIVYCNSRITPVTGYTPEMLFGKHIADMLAEESRELIGNFSPATETETGIEVDLLTSSAEKVTLEARIVRVVDTEEETRYYGVARNVSERKKAEARLEAYQQELRSLASQLILTEARERKKIATLIHDRVGQSLSISKIKLGILKSLTSSKEEESTIGEIIALIDQIIKDTRSLIFTVSSPLLYELGLDAALEKLVEQFDSEHHIGFTYDGPDEPLEIDTDISLLLFDAVKELMMNAVKHSHAGNVCVSMKGESGRVILAVKDDGTGFNRTHNGGGRKGGYGLFSIRERLDTIGGSCVVNSSALGSEVVLSSPTEGKEHIEHSYSHR